MKTAPAAITQTTIIDRDGRIYRHVYGEEFPVRMFMEPLKDVVYGTTTSFTLGHAAGAAIAARRQAVV